MQSLTNGGLLMTEAFWKNTAVISRVFFCKMFLGLEKMTFINILCI